MVRDKKVSYLLFYAKQDFMTALLSKLEIKQ